MSAEEYLLLLREADEVVCVERAGAPWHASAAAANELGVVRGGSVLVGLDGRVAAVGPAAEVAARAGGARVRRTVECRGRALVPGLVDAHTHPVWAGDRVHEFAWKLAGASYMEVHQKGGGIGFSVRYAPLSSRASLLFFSHGNLK